MTKQVCVICEIEFKDGLGWVGEHVFPCANDRYGWNFTKEIVEKPQDVNSMPKFGPFKMGAV